MWPCRPEWPTACLTRGAGKVLHGMLQEVLQDSRHLDFAVHPLHTLNAKICSPRLRSRLLTSTVPSPAAHMQACSQKLCLSRAADMAAC